MRANRPQPGMPQPPPAAPRPPGAPPIGDQSAADQSDVIGPFLASGGYSFWPEPAEFVPEWVDPAGDGAQLVTSAYVPYGRVGFVKEIRIAPMKPAILQDVWNTTGIPTPPGFGTFEAARGVLTYTGLWTTPMAWEAYFTDTAAALNGGFVPDPWLQQLAWQWQLTLVPGDLATRRSSMNVPPFSFADPTSWYLVPSIPVPASTYSGGFPGGSAGPLFEPQRYPVLPNGALQTHVLVPENTTICLWARWYNVVVPVEEGTPLVGVVLKYRQTNEEIEHEYGGGTPPDTVRVPIIGPSVGSLHGYLQPAKSPHANGNATSGWGG